MGLPAIEIGATEFMCIGAKPPFDHPHIFIDMGDDKEAVCPYCSTLYKHNPALAANEARPADAVLKGEAAKARCPCRFRRGARPAFRPGRPRTRPWL